MDHADYYAVRVFGPPGTKHPHLQVVRTPVGMLCVFCGDPIEPEQTGVFLYSDLFGGSAFSPGHWRCYAEELGLHRLTEFTPSEDNMTNAERLYEALSWVRAELEAARTNQSYTKETLITNLRDRVDAALGEGAYAPREEKTCAYKAKGKDGMDILLCLDCVKAEDLDAVPLNREELASQFITITWQGKALCGRCYQWIYPAEDV